MTSENSGSELSMLIANPHLYDYIHSIDFRADGTMMMVDGAGQRINGRADGRYSVRPLSADVIEIAFADLRELKPPSRTEVLGSLEPFAVTARIERGPFAFREQTFKQISSEGELPCLLYDRRYVFEKDPLSFAEERQRQSLYYEVKSEAARAATIAAARIYYPRSGCQNLALGDLRAQGIEPI